MRLAILLVVVAALGAGAVAWSSPQTSTRAWTAREPAFHGPLFGLVWGRGGATLVSVDRRTFRALPGRRLKLGQSAWSWAFSPDRSHLAVGADAGGVQIVDPVRMRVVRTISSVGKPDAIAWPAPDRVVWAEPFHVVAADPTTGRVLRSTFDLFTLQRSAVAPGGLVLLAAPNAGMGPARLVVLGPDGRMRTVALPRIRAGTDLSGGPTPEGTKGRDPGLALDPQGGRAFVVGDGEPVAEVDLATLRVRYHTLSHPSFLSRLRGWLDPAAAAKGLNGPDRRALWLGNDVLAVTGEDGYVSTDVNGGRHFATTRLGVTLVDTRSWRTRRLDDRASRVHLAGSLLAAYGAAYDENVQRNVGAGLSLYRPDGTRLAHLFGSQPVWTVWPVGSRALVPAGSRIAVVDLDRASVVGTVKTPMAELLVDDSAGMDG